MDRTRRLLVAGFALLVFTLSATPPTDTYGLGREFLPPEHWVYEVLRRFEALGMVELPSERPYTRPDVVGYVEVIRSRASGAPLSARDRFDLDRLEEEFYSDAAQEDPRTRFDPPLLFASDASLDLEGDLAVSVVPNKEPFDPQWAFFLDADPQLRLHFRDWITYEVRYKVRYGPERGDRVDRQKPSPRERSWRGATALYERAYINYQRKSILLFWGREYADWGPSENGNLIISRTAQSLDSFGGRIGFKNLRLSLLHSTLSSSQERHLWAHRLEMRFPRLLFGLSESVIYTGRGFDPVYALPLSSFYSNQFNERGNDNVVWEFDLKYAIRNGLLVYGSLFIDDFQFERDGEQPDKLAFDVGGRVALASPVATTVRFQYRYVDIYTYTHKDSINYYLTGEAEPGLDFPVGAAQGPDTDIILVDATAYPVPSLAATVSFSLSRRGEGNDFRIFQTGDDAYPSFPSGVVEKTYAYGAGVEWVFKGNSSAGADVVWSRVQNIDHQAGRDEWTTGVRVHFNWDL